MRINPTARTMWDELAATAAAVQDEEAAVAALGVVVLALESAAGAPRWRVEDEPLIVLQRRFAHAQRRLEVPVLSVAQLEEHLITLGGAARRAGQPVSKVMSHAAVRAMPAPCSTPC